MQPVHRHSSCTTLEQKIQKNTAYLQAVFAIEIVDPLGSWVLQILVTMRAMG